MSAHSTSSYILSLTVHGAAVALLMTIAWVFTNQAPKPVAIFELVAGVGDNYAATEAPALGSPTGADLKVPAVPIPPPMTLPKIDEPAPLPPIPVESKPVPVPEPVPVPPPTKAPPVKETAPASSKPAIVETKPTTFTQDVKRLSNKREKRRMDQYHKEQAAKAKKEAEAQKRMTEEEFRKKYGVAPGKSGTPAKIAKVDARGIANGVVGGSTANDKGGANGTALSRQEASLMEAYYSLLLQRLQESHVPPPSAGAHLVATVTCFIAVDGSITKIRVLHSSGNSEFDQSTVEAFRKVTLPVRPDGRSGEVTMDFKARER